MGIRSKLALVPPAAALFGAAFLGLVARFALTMQVSPGSFAILAAAGALAAGIPAALVCRKLCRVREKSQAADKRFDSVWESKLLGMVVTDPEFNLREANPTFLSMTGYGEAELRAGIPLRDLTTADFTRVWEGKREQLAEHGHIGPYERDWVRKDGSRFTSLVYVSRLADSCCLAMIFDITEWKATQLELSKRESRYHDLVSSRLIGVFVTDMKGRICEANDTYLGMIRRTRGELEAGLITSQSMATPEWLYGAEKRRDQFLVEGTMGPMEREWVLHDGTRLHTLFFVTKTDETGKALCMAIDAGELKQTRLKLHAVETRYKKLFDSNIVGIAIVDGHQVFAEANDTFLRMVGYDRTDLAAGRLTSYALRLPDAERAKSAGDGTVYVRKDGSRIPVFRGVTRLDEDEKHLLIVVDLSVLKATQTTDTASVEALPQPAHAVPM